MPESFTNRLKHAWNAFLDKDSTIPAYNLGASYTTRPDRIRLNYGNEKSIVSSIYNRIAIDVAAIRMQHVRTDQNGTFLEKINSGLNECLTVQANLDQTGRSFMQDVVLSLFDEGCVAIVPIDTNISRTDPGIWDIRSLRTAKIVQWYPKHVRLNVYNEETGLKQDITLPKKNVAIIENPLYAVMNEQNSTLKRLIHKLNLLDAIDDQSGSGKLDLIIQLPYVIKTETRRQQAEQRRQDIETQLKGSKYGIAYTDGTERVTQLNRPVENNLMAQIEFLTRMLHSQLGLTENIFNGTAKDEELINYFNRTVDPVLAAIADGMACKFITKTGRSQGQSIAYYRNPFAFATAQQLSDMADKFTRNEIVTSNEFRGVIGFRPSKDPKADELRNKNISQPPGSQPQEAMPFDPEAVNELDKGVSTNGNGEFRL